MTSIGCQDDSVETDVKKQESSGVKADDSGGVCQNFSISQCLLF